MQRKVYISKFSQRNPVGKQAQPDSPKRQFGFQPPVVPSYRGSISPQKTTSRFVNQSFDSAAGSLKSQTKTSLTKAPNNIRSTSALPPTANFARTSNQVNSAQQNKENGEPASKIEMFKNANFSFIELMNKNRLNMSLQSQSSRANSQLSTPRLTPLRMIERNRASDKNDINQLESKILELERQICTAKQQGEDRKLDLMERSIQISPEAKLDAAVELLEKSGHKFELDLDDLRLLEDCEIELSDYIEES